ncbi:Alpha/Beta hydrolase protein [Fusarium sp. MPI-SDFR-AT-0072]|nr:Alpha/Beta hydrolase protein [Fusarium sp. MPI-SDFR-AT-0072]
MWASKLLKGRNARSITKTSIAAAASAPTSQAEFSANSQAFSVAVTELLECLDFVLDQLDDQGEHGDLLQFHLSRLAKEISKDRDLLELLLAACRCACSVYKPDVDPGGDLVPVISRTPSITGTVKATSIWKSEDTNTLFVSIRGTSCKTDHLVNFNRNQKDAASVFAFPGINEQVFAHSGFLACAATLLPWLTEEIIRQVTADKSLKDIVFTGHSAGGAVAAMVFLHFVCHFPSELSNAKFSLITFGAPPVTSTNITELAQVLPQTRHIYAVVNEHDLVPRADPGYIASIISLYRSAYGLPLSEFNNSTFTNAQGDRKQIAIWELPPPDFYVVGNVIILRAKLDLNVLQSRPSHSSTDTNTPPQKLDIIQMSQKEFGKLLFFEISVHKRKIYFNRLEKLVQERGGIVR